MTAVLLLIYFSLVKLLYAVEPGVDVRRAPRRRSSSHPMAEMRQQAGDRDLRGLAMQVP